MLEQRRTLFVWAGRPDSVPDGSFHLGEVGPYRLGLDGVEAGHLGGQHGHELFGPPPALRLRELLSIDSHCAIQGEQEANLGCRQRDRNPVAIPQLQNQEAIVVWARWQEENRQFVCRTRYLHVHLDFPFLIWPLAQGSTPCSTLAFVKENARQPLVFQAGKKRSGRKRNTCVRFEA